MKINKSLLFTTLFLTLFSLTACQKQPTAEEINESIAQNKQAQEVESQAQQQVESEAQAKEDEKFHIKSEKEKQSDERASLEAGVVPEEYEDFYVVAKSGAEIAKDAPAFFSEDETSENSEDITEPTEAPLIYSINENYDIYDIMELEDGYYDTLVYNIKNDYYLEKQSLIDDINTVYKAYPEEVITKITSVMTECWDEWQVKREEIANQPNPWTEEELAENPGLKYMTREEYDKATAEFEAAGFCIE